ncbi:MAG: CDP-alcohol phosphatidyltransferase family protein [Pseudomonadales bacterium]
MNRRIALAWLAHLYTGLGLVCALLALRALGEERPLDVFLWLAAAFAIDASDGALARRVRVDLYTPHFSGRKLDDIIDYLNYTFVPVCFIWQQGLLSEAWLPVLGFTLIASAYGFCSEAAKTDDGYFTGFPSYWNVVAFYLYFLQPPELVAGTLIVVLALMTFWPVRYLYPTKSPEARLISLGGGALWGLLCLWLVRQPDAPRIWVYLSLLYPAWYMSFSFWLHFTKPPRLEPSEPSALLGASSGTEGS